MRRAALLVLGASSIGCLHADLSHNAPGHTDIRRRPTSDHEREPVRPGENMVVFAAGPYASVGGDLRGAGNRGRAELGAELSVFGGSSRERHSDGWLVTPETAFGVNLGATVLGANPRGGRPLYAEAAMRFGSALGLGAGWNVDAGDGVHGPQVTVNTGPLYVRFAHQFGNATFLSVGLVLKGQMTWVWSK